MTSSGKLSRAAPRPIISTAATRPSLPRPDLPRARAAPSPGATGFVGPHLVAALARQGWKTPPAGPPLVAPAVACRRRRGDRLGRLPDEASLKALVGGADAVLDAAGLIKARGRSNSTGSNATAPLACSGLAPDLRLLPLPHGGVGAAAPPYAGQAGGRGGRGRRPALGPVVRAPAVYGPWRSETLAYFKMVKSGLALEPDSPDVCLSLIHVEDLAEAGPEP